ncbi:MAG: phenylalanine--tRNA ligase subunit beta [Acidobacteriota bacterium]|nr:phenylalanine--tRNA ligase subunit beta [Acidobacteriota bacterium]
MRVPLEWLHDYCEPHLDAHTLAQRLALTGTAVERVERHGVLATENFVVGHVLERKKHPDADRLNVCMVDIGGSTPAQIVCGAPNVAAGQTVGVARPGAVMPDGATLAEARLRGVASQGMILSERELQISEDHAGIMVLGDGVAPGTPLGDVLQIGTDVLVLEITPNRPDCLGIYGVAREVAASTGAALKPPPWEQDAGSFGALDGFAVTNEAGPTLCPRFTARIFERIEIGPSPLWMKARLMACGQRPISSVVDITNYVMLLTGQPMHAFDYDRVAGSRLNVRRARPREQVQTLDDQTRTLDEDIVVIADADGPTSIAGVMGGARSEVSDATTTIVSEVATWNGPNVHATSLKLALRSEASSRNEKGLQPEQTLWAQATATKLFVEVCGATVRPGTIDVGGPGPEPATIRLRDARVEGLLGVAIPRQRSRQLLQSLGFVAVDAADGLDVTVPDFRRDDITREADLIEEVSRLDGLENLPATLPARHSAVGRLTPGQRLRRSAEDALAAQGLHEIAGWSFTGPEPAAKLGLLEPGASGPLTLANPMSSEQSQLRTTLLGSLLDVAARNRARGASGSRIALFESGAIYRSESVLRADALPEEPHHIGAILAGPVRAATWRHADPPRADLFAAKGVLDGLLTRLGIEWEARPGARPFLHPGRAAGVHVDGEEIGWLGEIHPEVAAKWDFDDTVVGFEIKLSALAPPAPAKFQDLVSFPAVNEDLAVVLVEAVSASELLRVIRAAGTPLVQEAEVFDVYRDAQRLGAGMKSVAVRLSYRASDRTLTDDEVARQRQLIVNALARELEGTIRAGE